jgi:hypothetical protein
MAEATRKRRTILIGATATALGLLVVALVFFLRLGARVDDIGASRFGMQMLEMPNGRQLYAKREVRGQNFDVVALSANANPCEPANPETDLIFRYDGNPLMISRSGDDLIVLRTGSYEEPKQRIPNLEVKQVQSDSAAPKVTGVENTQSINIPLQFARRGTDQCVHE